MCEKGFDGFHTANRLSVSIFDVEKMRRLSLMISSYVI